MATVPYDVVQEYEIPLDVTGLRIEAESSGVGRHSRSAITLQIQPGSTLRLRFVCLQEASENPASPAQSG